MKPLIVNCIFLLFMQVCCIIWLKLSVKQGKMAYFPLKQGKTPSFTGINQGKLGIIYINQGNIFKLCPRHPDIRPQSPNKPFTTTFLLMGTQFKAYCHQNIDPIILKICKSHVTSLPMNFAKFY